MPVKNSVKHDCRRQGKNLEILEISPRDSRESICMIRANRMIRANWKFEWFVRIGLTRYKNGDLNCEWFVRIDSRDSRCESPVPLSFGDSRDSPNEKKTPFLMTPSCRSRKKCLWRVHFVLCALKPGTKNQPKEEVFGMDIPRTSGGHSRGYPGPKLRSGPSKSWKKNKHLSTDIHDLKARTSTTLRDFQKLWCEFSFPT